KVHDRENFMVQAGWYTDPHDPNFKRYWGGDEWTDHIFHTESNSQSEVPLPHSYPAPLLADPSPKSTGGKRRRIVPASDSKADEPVEAAPREVEEAYEPESYQPKRVKVVEPDEPVLQSSSVASPSTAQAPLMHSDLSLSRI